MARLLVLVFLVGTAACGTDAAEVCVDEAGVCVPEGVSSFCTQEAPVPLQFACPSGEFPVTSWEVKDWNGETAYRSSQACVAALSDCY
jgi:hypothetical protein